MDGVILLAILLPSVIAMFVFLFQLINDNAGTKGISKEPYTTKSGVVHTAKKSRENHIV
jgi:hypothetical protein